MYLHSVNWDETALIAVRERLSQVLTVNTFGPLAYLKTYGRFTKLMDGSMKKEVHEFIEDSGEIKVCVYILSVVNYLLHH